MRVLTSMVSKLEKLLEDKLQFEVKLGTHQCNRALWSQQNNTKKSSNSMILFYGFQKGVSHILRSSTKKWFEPYIVQYVLPSNMILLATFINFEPNLMFININKLKPYKFIEYEVQIFEVQTSIYQEKPQETN